MGSRTLGCSGMRLRGAKMAVSQDVDKELKKNAAKIAGTFAPHSSTAKGKNPAFKGSALYTIFEVQAYLSLVVGSMLSYNVLLPSDEPNIARLMGLWSVWMFAVPSLRARECDPKEKDALNFLFIAIPLIMLSLIGLIFCIHPWLAYGFMAASMVYYARLSSVFLAAMGVWSVLLLALVHAMGDVPISGHRRVGPF